MHIVKHRDSLVCTMSCAKMAQLTEMQSGILSGWVQGTSTIHGDVDAPTGTGTWGVWLTEKHCKA